ncbi:MAG: hypothetical protein J0M02_08155 [Planctomycetes bacterium]|nr:hypothetical protein [Planctomycetota bacterium]
MHLRTVCLLLATAAIVAAGEAGIRRIIDTGADVPWVQGAWVSAGGQVHLVDDAPSGLGFTRCIEVEAVFPGKGFMFYNAEPAKPLLVPGRLLSLSVWHRGPGCTITLADGWNRGEANGRKFEWGLPDTKDAWKQSTFAIPADWVQPIRINGVATHNWGDDARVFTRSIRISALEAVYDLADTDLATGALKSWKPDPAPGERKDVPKECPRTPMLDLGVSSGREGNVFAGEEPGVSVSVRSWLAGRLEGSLRWSLTDLSSGAAAPTALKSGELAVAVEDRPFGQRIALAVPRLGLYRLDAEMTWKDGAKDRRSLVLAAIGAVPKDDDASRDASPYGLNTHGGGRGTVEAWEKAGIRWIRDYAWGFNQMLGARDKNGAFTGWPWYPKLVERYRSHGLRLMPCLMDGGIAKADGSTPKVPAQWRKDLLAILAGFPDLTVWELANEWDLDWENKHGAKADRAAGWPAYRAYHKAFGQVVSAAGLTAVENGRAGVYPDEVRSMVADGSFAGLQIVNGHYYTGVDAPETSASNANTGGGGPASQRRLTYQDLLRESYRAGRSDGTQRSFWLTEFGYDTKAGFIVSHFQQAVYLQRAWMINLANNVERSFWFYDFDNSKANVFFDGCGIMDDLAQPKLSYCTLSALTRILPNPKHLGPVEAGPGTWGYLFEDHGRLVAAMWTVGMQEGPQVEFASGSLVDFLGNALPGRRVKLGPAPVFCVGVDPGDRLVKQACYELDGLRLIDLAAGDRVTIPVAVRNHRRDGLKAQLKAVLPAGWTAAGPVPTVEVAAGAQGRAEVACTVAPDAKPGEYEVAVQIDEGGVLATLRTRVLVGPALTVTVPALGNRPGTSDVALTVVNRSQRTLDGTVAPRLPAGWKAEPASVPIAALASGAAKTLPFRITWDAGWKPGEEAWAEVATADGVAMRAALQPGVITIPKLKALKADGDLGEWPAAALLPGWVVGCAEGAADAEIRLAWNEQGLAVAVRAKDSRVQCTDARSFWEMDTLEIFLDSQGSFAERAFAATDHQFWLVPLPAEKRAYLGRWKRAQEIPEIAYDIPGVQSFAAAASGGYVYEALIPAARITGYQPKAGATMGMDLMLTVNGAGGKREVYWPWSKKDNPAARPQTWGMVRLGD